GDIILPTMSGEKICLRSIVHPENEQKIILQHLGIDLPRRMRIPDFISHRNKKIGKNTSFNATGGCRGRLLCFSRKYLLTGIAASNIIWSNTE
ncbi:MAG: hypothetical protein L6416_08695, partial [Candidatus Omnitrophica bacterium]|nr:hypothetical protein [Candidatus Omnitrophota bacterium]